MQFLTGLIGLSMVIPTRLTFSFPSYVPYKYAIEKLLALSLSKDQLDPSAYTVLTAKSKLPGLTLTDFCAFVPKWIHSQNAFRPPVSSLIKYIVSGYTHAGLSVLSSYNGFGNDGNSVRRLWRQCQNTTAGRTDL